LPKISPDKEQINLIIEKSWKTKLQDCARHESVAQNKDISYLELIKQLISTFLTGSGRT
jgi:hypothetical protein